MKTTKRLLVAVLALAMCASFLAFPALADEPISEHAMYEFRNYFPMMSRNSYNRGYTVALQCFLLGFPQSSSYISNSGGVDGSYGKWNVQCSKGLPDGGEENLPVYYASGRCDRW